jgi:hypothetical protein
MCVMSVMISVERYKELANYNVYLLRSGVDVELRKTQRARKMDPGGMEATSARGLDQKRDVMLKENAVSPHCRSSNCKGSCRGHR